MTLVINSVELTLNSLKNQANNLKKSILKGEGIKTVFRLHAIEQQIKKMTTLLQELYVKEIEKGQIKYINKLHSLRVK